MIYDQKKGSKCTLYALSGLITYLTDRVISDEAINSYYQKYDTDGRPGIRLLQTLRKLREKESLDGVHVKSFEVVYNQRGPERRKTGLYERAKYEYRCMNTGLLIGLRLGKGKDKIELKNNTWVSPTEKGENHLMFVKAIYPKGLVIQNSWGVDFGDRGTFKITKDDFLNDVQLLVSIKL